MVRLAILASALAAIVPTGSARPLTPDQPPLAGPTVVILWASWCASCRAEMARVPQLVGAAAPLPVATLAIDPPARALALLRERGQSTTNAYADDRPPRTVLDDWGGAGSALPIAIALNGDGRVCGRKLGLLGTDQLHQWATRCSK